VESGAYIREHFFGPDPRLRKLVEHLSDDDIKQLPRGGHDYRKLYAAYRPPRDGGRDPDGDPGQDGQGLDARRAGRGPQRHPPDQEDDTEQLRELRERLHLESEIPRGARPPSTIRRTTAPNRGSPEHRT
jgi:pyruvate dehydrogenase E1 component